LAPERGEEEKMHRNPSSLPAPGAAPALLGRHSPLGRTGEGSVRYAFDGLSPVRKGQKGPISVSTLVS